MGELDNEMLNTVSRYKSLAEHKENQMALIKDSAVVQFLVYALEGTSSAVSDAAMSAMEILAENKSLHSTLRNIFGVMESLQSIANSERKENNLSDRARIVHRKLDDSKKFMWQVPKTVSIYIPGMKHEDCPELWKSLSSIHGVISCNFNVEEEKCTLTVFSSMKAETLVSVIRAQTELDAEVFLPGIESLCKNRSFDLPAYLPEDDSPIQKKAVSRIRNKRRESGWFTKAATFVVDSLFW